MPQWVLLETIPVQNGKANLCGNGFSSPSIQKCTVDYNYKRVSARYRHLYGYFIFVLLNIKFVSNFGISIAEGLLNKFNYNSGHILKSSSP